MVQHTFRKRQIEVAETQPTARSDCQGLVSRNATGQRHGRFLHRVKEKRVTLTENKL